MRFVRRWWIVMAGLIWVFIKLPQEYWIHVAQLDVTDTLEEYDWAWPLLITLLVVLAAVLWFVVRPRLPEPDWALRMSPDPLPEEMDTAAERAAWRADATRVRSGITAEKVVLVGLLSVIFAQTVPGVDASNLELFLGTGPSWWSTPRWSLRRRDARSASRACSSPSGSGWSSTCARARRPGAARPGQPRHQHHAVLRAPPHPASPRCTTPGSPSTPTGSGPPLPRWGKSTTDRATAPTPSAAVRPSIDMKWLATTSPTSDASSARSSRSPWSTPSPWRAATTAEPAARAARHDGVVNLPVLSADCGSCFGLCCVLMPFSREAGLRRHQAERHARATTSSSTTAAASTPPSARTAGPGAPSSSASAPGSRSRR